MNKLIVSKSEIISDILKIARLLNYSPSSVEYKRHGRYDSQDPAEKNQHILDPDH
jgi:hypothetical protein